VPPAVADTDVRRLAGPANSTRRWNGVLAPAAVVAKLNTTINDGLRSDEMQASPRRLGAQPTIASPAALAAFMVAEQRKWSEVARAAAIRLD